MEIAAKSLIVVVALLHLYFLVLEMFLWATPFGMKTFGRSQAEQDATKLLAGNQGLYNGFLAAGLVWSAFEAPPQAFSLRIFFLLCVLVAGIYGGVTTARKILYVQALPALVTLVVVWLSFTASVHP
jgi:putative membrane protein